MKRPILDRKFSFLSWNNCFRVRQLKNLQEMGDFRSKIFIFEMKWLISCPANLLSPCMLDAHLSCMAIITIWHNITFENYDKPPWILFATVSLWHFRFWSCDKEKISISRIADFQFFLKSLFNWTIPVKYTGTECQVLFRKFWVIIRNVVGKSG